MLLVALACDVASHSDAIDGDHYPCRRIIDGRRTVRLSVGEVVLAAVAELSCPPVEVLNNCRRACVAISRDRDVVETRANLEIRVTAPVSHRLVRRYCTTPGDRDAR